VPEQYPPLLRPIEPHLKEIYRRIKTELPNAKLVTLLPFLTSTVEEKQPFHTVLDRYIEIIRTEATGKADEIIDLQPLFDEAEQLVTPALIARDSIHPTSMGHSVIASAVLSVLK
jgi:lysophospholipase L1-like esterase